MTEHLVGNLVRDPELRETPNGKSVASLRVAVNERVKGADGKWVNGATTFHDVTVWEDQAERLVGVLSKGMRIVAVGYTKTRTWESDGEQHSAEEFVANDIGVSLKFTPRQ